MTPIKQLPLIDLVAQYQSIKPEIDNSIKRVLDSGYFILGEEVTSLEHEVAEYLGISYGIGVASGTDALILALRALEIGPGDEVILPAYTFFATVAAVLHVGATPVLVDINLDNYCLDTDQVRSKITAATKVIIPVHLYGHPAEMDPLLEISKYHEIMIIEDNAQAFGAEYHGKKTGSMGDIACLSFFPSKNLGGYGDGGMIVTENQEVAEKIRRLRTHGWKKKYFPEILGYNSRLDALQAAILRTKLHHLDSWNKRRREIAERYNHALNSFDRIILPEEASGVRHGYHLYVIRVPEREKWVNELRVAGITSAIYYPQPLHLTKPCRSLGYKIGDFPNSEQTSRETLAIPLFPEMTDEQINFLLDSLIKVYSIIC